MAATVRGVAADGREGTLDKSLQHQYTVRYYVTTDDANDGPATISSAVGIPLIGEPYQLGNELDTAAFVVDKRATQRESPYEWEVEVTYSTPAAGEVNPTETDDPAEQPPEISFGFQSRTVVVPGYYQDPEAPSLQRRCQLGILASNGVPFDPQPEMEWHDPVIRVKKNLRTVSAIELMDIANTVNSVDFYGAYPRTFKLSPPTAVRQYHPTFGFYWECQFEFIYRWETWDLELLNRGEFWLDESPGQEALLPFKDAEGHPFVGLLDEDGMPINSGLADKTKWGRYFDGGDMPTWTVLRIYREIDFNSLGIL
jgi:hypothetical protein